PALARRELPGLRCVATSVATAEQAAALGLAVEPFDALERLDIAIDGADQVAPDFWLTKGGGGAHVREKVVAAAADRFIVIVGAAGGLGGLGQRRAADLLGRPGVDAQVGVRGRRRQADRRAGAGLEADAVDVERVLHRVGGGLDRARRAAGPEVGVGLVEHG